MKKLLFSLLGLFLITCEEEEPFTSQDDNYQESLRTYESEELSYRLAEGTKLLSPYQKEQLLETQGDTILYFSLDTEPDNLPRVGDIYFSSPDSEVCPEGFWGKIASVDKMSNRYRVKSMLIPLPEIFQEFGFTSEVSLAEAEEFYDGEGNLLDDSSLSYVTLDSTYVELKDTTADTSFHTFSDIYTRGVLDATFTLRELPWSFHLEGMDIDGSCEVGSDIRLEYRMPDYLRIDMEPFVQIKGVGQMELSRKLTYEETKKLLGKVSRIPIPIPGIPATPFTFSVDVFGYFEASASASVNAEVDISYGYPYSLSITEGENLSFDQGSPISKSDTPFKIEAKGNVELAAGLRLSPALNFVRWTLFSTDNNLYLDGKLGVKAEIPLEADAYELLKDAEVTSFCSLDCYAKLECNLNGENIEDEQDGCPFTKTWNIATCYLYPQFTDWNSIQNEAEENVRLYSTLSRNMLFPVKVGYGLFDSSGSLVDKYYAGEEYWLETEFSNPMNTTYYSLMPGETYMVYPVVQYPFADIEVMATEGYQFTMEEEEIEVTPGDAIDMGGSVLWASANLGAESPESYGTYFLFDSVEDSLDEGWRIPTFDEWNELLNGCEWKYRGSASEYAVFTSKTTGNVLLIPGAGFMQESELHKPDAYFYWLMDPDNLGWHGVEGGIDYISGPWDKDLKYRFPVRAVKDK